MKLTKLTAVNVSELDAAGFEDATLAVSELLEGTESEGIIYLYDVERAISAAQDPEEESDPALLKQLGKLLRLMVREKIHCILY